MINNELIVSKIKKLMEDNNLTPSSFANKINSKRANVSHILLGRNKPSLNFLIKIVKSFDNISLDWFINNEVNSSDTFRRIGDSNTNNKDENAKKINTIVHFYENGTFRLFENSD